MQLRWFQNTKTTQTKANRWLALLLLAASLALLGWVDWLAIVPLKNLSVANSGNDFSVFWAGARTVGQGGNPYLTGPGSTYRNIVTEAGGDLQPLEPFISPHYLTLFFLPLAGLPLGLAATLWLLIMQGLLGLAVFMMAARFGSPLASGPPLYATTLSPEKTQTGRLWLIVALLGLVMLWRYTFLVMMGGNLSLLLLFAIVASYYCSVSGRPGLAGAAAALLLVKPQVALFTLALLLVVPTGGQGWWNPATRRRWLGFAIAGAVFAIYSFGLMSNWPDEWFRAIFRSDTAYLDSRSVDSSVTSLRSLAALIAPGGLVLPTLVVLAVPFWAGLAGLWWRFRNSTEAAPFLLGIGIAVSILTTPYIRDYDNAMLLWVVLLSYLTVRRLDLLAGRRVGWRNIFWLLVLLPYPVHLLASQWGYAIEITVPLTLIITTLLVWRSNVAKTNQR